MNKQPTRHRHIAASLPAVVATLAERPELAACFPIADALSAGVRWSA
jgi:hypothetical protein